MQPEPKTSLGDSALLATLTFVVAAVVAVGAALSVAIVGAILATLRGVPAAEIEAHLSGYGATLVTILVSQAAMLGVAVGAWKLTGAPFRTRLGLVAPRVTKTEGVILLVAGGVPAALSLLAASVPPSMGDGAAIEAIWNNLPVLPAILWILTIGLLPGTVEELLFRGMIQRGFMRRLSPVAAILLTSFLFALMHIDPPSMALALVLGLWLGVLAWRTESIVLPMLTHILVNSGWNAGQFVVRQTEMETNHVLIAVGVIGAVSLVAFVLAIGILRRAGAVPSART
ncbi:MAG: CPBP family intramembrane metalloprotease [Phycisphaerae bacterium]|nr:CPBP family intramembrane metalloprotease [Phycisphaerae bacterium]